MKFYVFITWTKYLCIYYWSLIPRIINYVGQLKFDDLRKILKSICFWLFEPNISPCTGLNIERVSRLGKQSDNIAGDKLSQFVLRIRQQTREGRAMIMTLGVANGGIRGEIGCDARRTGGTSNATRLRVPYYSALERKGYHWRDRICLITGSEAEFERAPRRICSSHSRVIPPRHSAFYTAIIQQSTSDLSRWEDDCFPSSVSFSFNE